MRILLRSLFIAIALVAAGGVLQPWLAGLAYAVRLASRVAPVRRSKLATAPI
jgi:hypothetical protein